MVSLFITDIDGCLSEVYQPYALEGWKQLAAYARAAETDPALPKLAVCSGRSGPYVEAVSQALGLNVFSLFEAGAGMINTRTGETRWNPNFDTQAEADMQAVQVWMKAEAMHQPDLAFDYGKRTQSGVVSASEAALEAFRPRVEAFVAAHYPQFVVFHTRFSIDVVPQNTTKREGMMWIAEVMQTPQHKIAYIGDSVMDVEALKGVGFPFAPANAVPDVKVLGIQTTMNPYLEGVLEAYEWCASWNRMKMFGRDTVPTGV